MRERLVIVSLFGIPVMAASVLVAWSSARPVSAQTTGSSVRLGPIIALVQPSDIVDLASSEKGIVKEMTIEEGDTVKRGQVVCRLESSVEEAALEVSKSQADSDIDIKVAKIRYELAAVQLKRIQDLEKSQAAAPMEVDEARINESYSKALIDKAVHDKELAKSQYIRDQRVIERRTIHSPLDGYVAKKSKSVGELLDGVDDTVVCQIAKLNPLHVLVPTPTDAYGKVGVGDVAVLSAPQLPEGQARAKVILVDRIVQPDSQTYTIKLELPNPGNKIPAGIKVSVVFP